MRFNRTKNWISLLGTLSLVLWASLASAELPKNVILMISDGMGYNTMKAADYWTGAPAVYESFGTQFSVSTFSANNTNIPAYDPAQAWTNFNYLKSGATDSASAATAIATGVKNYDGQINWSTTGQPLTNIVQIAGAQNKATGVVTTVEWSHATPAGMVAHNVSRNNYSQLANEMLGSNLNVIMGAGNPNFNDSGGAATTPNYNYVGGSATWNALNAGTLNGWTSIQAKSDFEALAATTNPALLPDKVVGTVQAATTTQQSRDAGVKGADAANPSGVAFNTNVPSLATMSTAALNILNQNDNGLFLMIEGGAVDWANHANQLGRAIEEQMDFNDSVQAVVDWVNANSNWNDTLLIVTADHETGDLWGPTAGTFNNIVDNGAGTLPGAHYNSGDHTNELIPLFAMGAGSELFAGYADQSDPGLAFYGLSNDKYLDNTEIFQVMNGNAVPLPAAVWLLGSGLAGLGFLRRKSLSA